MDTYAGSELPGRSLRSDTCPGPRTPERTRWALAWREVYRGRRYDWTGKEPVFLTEDEAATIDLVKLARRYSRGRRITAVVLQKQFPAFDPVPRKWRLDPGWAAGFSAVYGSGTPSHTRKPLKNQDFPPPVDRNAATAKGSAQ